MLEAEAVLHDDGRRGQAGDVGRGGLVVVGVDVGPEEAVDVGMVAADHPGEVGQLGGGGHDGDPVADDLALRRGVAGSAGGRDRQEGGEGEDGGGGTSHGGPQGD